MKQVTIGGRRVLLIVSALVVFLALGGMHSKTLAQDLPDLVASSLYGFEVTQRLEGNTLEFGIWTANIGGQDYVRPRDPDTGGLLLTEIYEYALFLEQDGQFMEVDRRRKRTICNIDSGVAFACIQEHGPRFTCSAFNQGISRGWADLYGRGLTGQWVFIGDNVGHFRLDAILDPDEDLQRLDIPDSGRDGDPTNNLANVFFDWDGTTLSNIQVVLGFDPDAVCPLTQE